jgi:hypothetical protein
LFGLLGLKRAVFPFDEVAFIHASWAKATPTERGQMSGDLLRNHLRVGIPRSQVEALIGRDCATVGAVVGRGAHTHEYYIGNWSMQGMDDAFVYVHYDPSDIVISAEIDGY